MGDDATRAEGTTVRPVDFDAIRNTERFQSLRRRHRNFVIPVTVASLVWYLLYVVLAGWAREFMSAPVFGSVNVGIILGLAQFVTTFAVTTLYVSFANRKLDPTAAEIREELEEEGVR